MPSNVDIGLTDPWFIGASRRFTIPITDADGNAKTVTGSSVASWRLTDIAPSAGTPTTLISKTLGSGVTLSGASEVTIEVDEADSADLTPGDYYHEFRLVDAASDTDTTTYGTVRLKGSAF